MLLTALQAIEEHIVRSGSAASWRPFDVAIMSWALATSSYRSPALLSIISDKVVQQAGNFNCQQLGNTAWAFAQFGHAEPAALDALAG